MRRGVERAGVVVLVVLLGSGVVAQDAPPNPKVVIETTEGDITVELLRGKAPASVVNFLLYVRDGYYEGTVFHRVIRNFMIQAGGFTDDLTQKTEGLRPRTTYVTVGAR